MEDASFRDRVCDLGKTCYCDGVGDVPILVNNGVDGIVISPRNADLLADSIIYLAENPELRNFIIKRSH